MALYTTVFFIVESISTIVLRYAYQQWDGFAIMLQKDGITFNNCLTLCIYTNNGGFAIVLQKLFQWTRWLVKLMYDALSDDSSISVG